MSAAEKTAAERWKNNPWHCEHNEGDELRRRVNKAGAISYTFQCLRCGLGSKKQNVPKSQVRGPVPPWDETLHVRFSALASEIHNDKRAADDERWWAWYNSYLLTPEWATVRAKVMARSGGVCEGCGDRPPAQVHHLTYQHAGAEFLWELRAVCNHCHERAHAEEPS